MKSAIRELDQKMHPDATFADAIAGERVDGSRRAQSQATYDWQRDGVRVACKSGGMGWDDSNERWRFLFQKLKPAGAGGSYDELLLAAYTPKGLYVYRHDGRLSLTKAGISTAATGKMIQIYGPSNEPSWQSALDGTILPKLDANCERVAQIEWS